MTSLPAHLHYAQTANMTVIHKIESTVPPARRIEPRPGAQTLPDNTDRQTDTSQYSALGGGVKRIRSDSSFGQGKGN